MLSDILSNIIPIDATEETFLGIGVVNLKFVFFETVVDTSIAVYPKMDVFERSVASVVENDCFGCGKIVLIETSIFDNLSLILEKNCICTSPKRQTISNK